MGVGIESLGCGFGLGAIFDRSEKITERTKIKDEYSEIFLDLSPFFLFLILILRLFVLGPLFSSFFHLSFIFLSSLKEYGEKNKYNLQPPLL